MPQLQDTVREFVLEWRAQVDDAPAGNRISLIRDGRHTRAQELRSVSAIPDGEERQSRLGS